METKITRALPPHVSSRRTDSSPAQTTLSPSLMPKALSSYRVRNWCQGRLQRCSRYRRLWHMRRRVQKRYERGREAKKEKDDRHRKDGDGWWPSLKKKKEEDRAVGRLRHAIKEAEGYKVRWRKPNAWHDDIVLADDETVRMEQCVNKRI